MIVELPSPGIYRNVPFETYLDWPAISNSALTWMAKSPAHFRHAQAGKLIVEESAPMRLGTLCHAGQFEPDRVIERYAVMPAFEDLVRTPTGGRYTNAKASAAYKAEVAEWTAEHADRIVVSQDEFDRMAGVVTAIAAHPRAAAALDGQGETEVSLVWNDPETGLPCKARIDFLNLNARRIVDLKTTADASDWPRVIHRREYHRQFAFYRSGVQALAGVTCECVNIVAETSPPYLVRCAPLSAELLAAGADRYRSLLRRLADCLTTGNWPGYQDPPEWNFEVRDDEPVNLIIGGEKVSL